jgi:hypothetical protein
MCCKQNAGLRIIFRRDSHYLSHVLRYAGTFPCATASCIQCVWQQDGATRHYHRDVTRYLNQTFPLRLVGRGGYFPWPTRTPDIHPWVFVKDNVYIPPMTVDLHDLHNDCWHYSSFRSHFPEQNVGQISMSPRCLPHNQPQVTVVGVRLPSIRFTL